MYPTRSPELSAAKRLSLLKRRAEFLRVAGARQKWAAPGLILQACPTPIDDGRVVRKGPFRVGFTVSRRVGNAVERNRVRRRLREVAKRIIPAHAVDGIDFVIIGRSATLKRPFDALIGDLRIALRKLNAYHD
ncbi:MAG: ribonuclease P protein component [Pseudomonadota bacterium]|nr:ribonuclease P protein component [Pseudomonadota bacterium]